MLEIDFTGENILFGLCSQRVPGKIKNVSIILFFLVAKLSFSQYKYGKHAQPQLINDT